MFGKIGGNFKRDMDGSGAFEGAVLENLLRLLYASRQRRHLVLEILFHVFCFDALDVNDQMDSIEKFDLFKSVNL